MKPDVCLIACGRMSNIALSASRNLFFEEELIVKVLVPSLVNPIPADDFIDSVNESGKLLIVDEGVKLGVGIRSFKSGL